MPAMLFYLLWCRVSKFLNRELAVQPVKRGANFLRSLYIVCMVCLYFMHCVTNMRNINQCLTHLSWKTRPFYQEATRQLKQHLEQNLLCCGLRGLRLGCLSGWNT